MTKVLCLSRHLPKALFISGNFRATNGLRFVKQNCLTKVLCVSVCSKLFSYFNPLQCDSLRYFFQAASGRHFTFLQSCLPKQSALNSKFTFWVCKKVLLTKSIAKLVIIYRQVLVDRRHVTKVFAIAGLDGRTIGSKTLFGFSSGLTLIIKRQILSSTFKTIISFGTSVTEHRVSCHRKYLSRWWQC